MSVKVHKISMQYNEWTSADWQRAAALTLIPGSAALIGIACNGTDKRHINWWKSLAKPTWAPDDRVSSALNLLTLAPLGVAAHMVYKSGGGGDNPDVKLALVSYVAMGGVMLVSLPAVLNHDLQSIFYGCVAGSVVSTTMAILFNRVDKNAAMLVVPFTLWTLFKTCQVCTMVDMEKKTF